MIVECLANIREKLDYGYIPMDLDYGKVTVTSTTEKQQTVLRKICFSCADYMFI